jgi:putative hydrolase of the HAD superfamily
VAHSFDLVALDLGNVLSLVDESVGARELARLSGMPEQEVFAAVFAPARKVLLETGRQTFDDFAADCATRLGATIPAGQFRAVYESVLTPNLAVFPLVERLVARGRVGLCSNTSAVHWELERRRLPFASRLDPVIVSYEVGVMKPDPAIFHALASAAGVPAQLVLFVDDRAENVDGAKRAGLEAVQFTGVARLERDLKTLGVL